MKVKDLIEFLQTCDQDIEVVMPDYAPIDLAVVDEMNDEKCVVLSDFHDEDECYDDEVIM